MASINVAPGVGDAVSSALVDPYIQIDPAFPLANEFSFEYSPFIANELTITTEVPEPSTLLLVSGGLLRWQPLSGSDVLGALGLQPAVILSRE
jgi:hypothetical protein